MLKQEEKSNRQSQPRLLQSIAKRHEMLSKLSPAIGGLLYQRAGKCANPDCDCHQGVKKHFPWQLTSTIKGKKKTLYIPIELLEKIRGGTKNDKAMKRILKEMSDLCEKNIRTAVPKARVSLRAGERKVTLAFLRLCYF